MLNRMVNLGARSHCDWMGVMTWHSAAVAFSLEVASKGVTLNLANAVHPDGSF